MKTINIAINIFPLHCSHACVQVIFYIIAHNTERFKLKYRYVSCQTEDRTVIPTCPVWRIRDKYPVPLVSTLNVRPAEFWWTDQNFKVFLTDILKSEHSKCCVILCFEFPMIAIRKYWLLVGGFLVYLTLFSF